MLFRSRDSGTYIQRVKELEKQAVDAARSQQEATQRMYEAQLAAVKAKTEADGLRKELEKLQEIKAVAPQIGQLQQQLEDAKGSITLLKQDKEKTDRDTALLKVEAENLRKELEKAQEDLKKTRESLAVTATPTPKPADGPIAPER